MKARRWCEPPEGLAMLLHVVFARLFRLAKFRLRISRGVPAGRRPLRDGNGNALAVAHIAQQAAQFLLDHGVTLARAGLQSGPLEH